MASPPPFEWWKSLFILGKITLAWVAKQSVVL